MSLPGHRRHPRAQAAVKRLTLAGVALAMLAAACDSGGAGEESPPPEDTGALVQAQCSGCHKYPGPEVLPRFLWDERIREMYSIATERGVTLPLPVDTTVAWYLARAPEQLPRAEGRTNAGWGPVDLRVADWRPPNAPPPEQIGPGTVGVRFARLFGGPGADLVVSDARQSQLYAVKPYSLGEGTIPIGDVREPGRVEVVDLDRDGREDLVVAGLGQFMPSNDLVGTVIWFRRVSEYGFERHVLADGLGRVADVRAADLNGDDLPDLVVAVFGWRENGQVMWMENLGGGPGRVEFVRHVLDSRPGSIDVRVEDFDGDGHLDIAALLSQEYEQVMVYWGGEDGYRGEAVYAAPHPGWGFSGMEAVDFTGDGRVDLVTTNGDALDSHLVRPDHGVGLLENGGDRTFRYHELTHMYGAYRAVPVDLKGDGQLGLLVCAHLLPFMVSHPDEPVEGIIWLERVGPTQLVRRVLKGDKPYHLSMDVGDFTGEGRMDFAVAWMDFARFVSATPEQLQDWEPVAPWVSFWRNDGLLADAEDSAGVDIIDWSLQDGS